MKKTKILIVSILAMLLLAGPAPLRAQSGDLIRLMEKLDGKEGVTSVLVTKKMFELFTKTTDLELEGQSLNDVIGGLEELLIIEVGNWEPVAENLKDEVNAIMKRDRFETLMKVVDNNERVEIFILEEGDVIRHLFMYVENDDEDTSQLISIKGRINLEEISKLSGTLNIEGLKHLEKEE